MLSRFLRGLVAALCVTVQLGSAFAQSYNPAGGVFSGSRSALPSTTPSACPNIYSDWYASVPADKVKLADGNCYTKAICAAGWTYDASTNTCLAPLCPGGQVWNGSACSCPVGLIWNGSACTSVPACPGGQVWNGSACTCTGGLIWNGSMCVPPSCPPGQLFSKAKGYCTSRIAIPGRPSAGPLPLNTYDWVYVFPVYLMPVASIPNYYIRMGFVSKGISQCWNGSGSAMSDPTGGTYNPLGLGLLASNKTTPFVCTDVGLEPTGVVDTGCDQVQYLPLCIY